jgi:hypothetical protein
MRGLMRGLMRGRKRLDGQELAGVAEAIELARALGALSRSLVVYGIEGKNFAAGVGLSYEVEKAAGEHRLISAAPPAQRLVWIL